MTIRTAQLEDIDAITAVETECFPPAEAATKEEFAERLKYYKDHFWLMFDEKRLVAFVDGMVTSQKDLTDEMYEKADLHEEQGDWQMIFGVNTIPAYRRRGLAEQLLKELLQMQKPREEKGWCLPARIS